MQVAAVRRNRWLKFLSESRQESAILFLRNPLTVFGMVLVLGWVAVALLAPFITPYPDDAFGVHNNALISLRPPSGSHPFGTDQLGRDILSRVIVGSRTTMTAGFVP